MKSIPKEEYPRLAVLCVFATAMGYLESTVVFYLRLLYYPNGFAFPLNPLMDTKVITVEGFRELSTLVMLLAAAFLASSKWKDRFAYFLFTFAIWDIFYYVWLKALLDWPASLQTFDVLFLIPWPWVGPVLAPVVASFTMIALAVCLLKSEQNPNLSDWKLWISGSLAIVVSFLADYGSLIVQGGYFPRFFHLAKDEDFQKQLASHIPGDFSWILFIAGEVVILAGLYNFYERTKE